MGCSGTERPSTALTMSLNVTSDSHAIALPLHCTITFRI
jgi:hypothetical protein